MNLSLDVGDFGVDASNFGFVTGNIDFETINFGVNMDHSILPLFTLNY